VGDLIPENIEELGDEQHQKRFGSKFAKVSVLSTHIGMSAFHDVSTKTFRRWRNEGLPLLTVRMKAAGALNPDDLDRPLDSLAEVVRQFVWGSPKMRCILYHIQLIILGNRRPTTHRKLFFLLHTPRSAEMCLKVS
jgi:hypothetical protein